MKKVLVIFMALLMIGAAGAMATGVSGGSVRDTIPVTAEVFHDAAVSHDVFVMAPALLETSGIFNAQNGLCGKGSFMPKEVIPVVGYSKPAVFGMNA
jgi:hypothetical protein